MVEIKIEQIKRVEIMVDYKPLSSTDNAEEKQQHNKKQSPSYRVRQPKWCLPLLYFTEYWKAVEQFLKRTERVGPSTDELVSDDGQYNKKDQSN